MQPRFISAQGAQHLRQSMVDYPRPDRAAAKAVRDWAKQQGIELNPDKVDAVTLHYQIKGQRCIAQVVQKMTLTQALLSNWQGESSNDWVGAALHLPWAGDPPPYPIEWVDSLPPKSQGGYGAPYLVHNGLYRRGKDGTYSATSHVRLPAEAFQRFIWDMDFDRPYKKMLDAFWTDGLRSYRNAAKINFIAACNKQVSQASLSDAGRTLAWQVADLQTRPDWAELGRPPRSTAVVQVAGLNIYGYVATNLLCMRNMATGLTLLYIPGNSCPFHEFSSESAMKQWIAEQCRVEHTRQALAQHFAPDDSADTLGFSGLATALIGLGMYPAYHHFDPDHHPGFATSGLWNPQDIVNYKANRYSPAIGGDLFLAMAKRQKRRTAQDADFIINTDSSVTKQRWRGYLDSAINTLAPIAMVLPELAPIFAIGGVFELGTGLDKMLHGKTLQARASGVEDAVWGLLNATPLLHLPVPDSPAIFRVKRPEFVSPRQVNGRLGYPMGPMQAPHLPPVEPELGIAFGLPDSVAPLSGADPQLADAVVRVPNFTGERDTLQCVINGYITDVHYDIDKDAFTSSEYLNHVDPAYYVAPAPGQTSMSRLEDIHRPVSNAQRSRTLRALGVDLELPVDLTALREPEATAIPKRISCIWVGDKVINPALLENVGRNARLLQDSAYDFRLFLSESAPEAYARNVELLRIHAPKMKVIALEQHPFYDEFRRSRYFAQYRAAIEGNGGVATNYSSACDVMRYRLLNHEGGLYLDMDDSLLGKDQHTLFGDRAEPIDSVPLEASPTGLVVSAPVSNESLGMTIRYNGSMIGSHAGNPTLDTISETMLSRFEARLDFYSRRPNATHDRDGFMRYAADLNHMTGPGVLNDVITVSLPKLARFREVWNTGALPTVGITGFIDREQFVDAYKAMAPLSRFAKIGSTLSWMHT